MKQNITLFCLILFTSVGLKAQNNVTFQVDMNQVSGFTTPEVNGDFNGWCGNCNQMTDANSDGIWDVTLPLTQDSIEFKFSADNWGSQENLTPGSSCTKTTSGFTNRFIYITGDTVLPVVCWESCIACGTPPDTAMVTFQVDVSQYTGSYTTPELNGTFNGWCGNCNAMTDANSDDIWEITLPLTDDSIEFKFSHDNWAGQENLMEGMACTKTSSGFTNRFIHINGDTTLPVVCWESCMACVVPVDSSMVTFSVDMSMYTGTYTTPELNGTFNGWCGNCNAMTDANNDSIWEITVELPNDTIEYKFSHDNWTGQEELTEGLPCTMTTSGFTNRVFEIMGDTVLPTVCWESCEACPADSGVFVQEIANLGGFNVFPNPTADVLTIDLSKVAGTSTDFEVFNLMGQSVVAFTTFSESTKTIDVSSLSNGLYTLVAFTKEGRSVSQFMISR